MEDFINSFMDDDTSAGEVQSNSSATSLWLWQRDYNGEETVFMTKPVVTLGNQSGGEPASATVTNVSAHEVELLDFDGRNGELNSTNVLFIGDTGINRANLQTAKNAGDSITGTDAVLIDGGANDLQDTIFGTTTVIANNTSTNEYLRTNFSSHGDDFLLGGNGNDTINAGTGDDRVEGSTGTDAVDGGKNYYAVKVLGESQSRVYVLNKWEAANPSKVTALSSLTISSITLIDQNEDGHGTSRRCVRRHAAVQPGPLHGRHEPLHRDAQRLRPHRWRGRAAQRRRRHGRRGRGRQRHDRPHDDVQELREHPHGVGHRQCRGRQRPGQRHAERDAPCRRPPRVPMASCTT